MIRIVLLGPEHEDLLNAAGTDVFDGSVLRTSAKEFLEDPRHHIAAALSEDRIVGFASAVHYLHPDKLPELFINEVGVADSHRRQGLATRLLRELLRLAKKLGCVDAWILSDRSNGPAMRLYAGIGGVETAEDVVMYSFPLDSLSRSDP